MPPCSSYRLLQMDLRSGGPILFLMHRHRYFSMHRQMTTVQQKSMVQWQSTRLESS